MLQDTETNILASPRIRARNKEKARILVGDKVPVITNLLTPQQAGATSVITGSIQYVDVGIKLEVEPQVYVDNDVGHQDQPRGQQHRQDGRDGLGHRLPDRHAQRADLAAPARRRDAGAGRPDQRPGPQHREQGAGARPGADRRQAVLLHQGRRDQERDRAVDHAAHRAAADPARGAQRRCLVGHRIGGAREAAAAGSDRRGQGRQRGRDAGAGAFRWRAAAGPASRLGRGRRATGSSILGGSRDPQTAAAAASRRSQCCADCGSHRRRCDWRRAVPARASAGARHRYTAAPAAAAATAPTYQRGRAPASIQPGRAMAPAAPSRPGRHRAPPPPPAAGRGERGTEDGRHATPAASR